MIRLNHKCLPLTRDDGECLTLDPGMLAILLEEIPEFMGMARDGVRLEALAECLVHHFREELRRESASYRELLDLSRSLLRGFAWEEALRTGRLDLFELARACGTGFELDFHLHLRGFFAAWGGRAGCLRLIQLRRCVRYLLGRRRWSAACARQADEMILSFRKEALRAGVGRLAILD